ncbi:phage tail protein [Rhodococcus erythropolis]|uniref:phage tail protein n=1 Tax=Rhodococcus erythropolis TaxID=1833 RepID=UPI0036719D3A
MTAPYANATVEATLNWGGLDAEFEARVRVAAEKAAKTAQKYFDRIRLAAKVDLKVDSALFRRETQAKISQLRFNADVTLRANTAAFHADVRRAARGLAEVTVKVKLDAGRVQEFVAGVESRLRAAHITAPVFLEVANESAFRARISQLTQTVTQRVNIVTHGGGGGGGGANSTAADNNNRLATSLGRVATSGLKIAGVSALIGAIGGAAGIAAGAVGALVAGLGAVGVAGAAGLATTLVGMQGIGDAFKAFSSQSSSSGADAAAQAKAVAAARKGIESANRGVEQADRNLEDAEKGVVRANSDSRRAQDDLTQAREDAVRQIEDLNFALKGTAIDERDAELALARAREAYDKAFTDPKASALDRAEAALGVDKALRRQDETLRRNADLEKEAQEAAAKGVEGSDQVVAAKEKVIDAADRVKDAEQGVADAQRGVADAQAEVVEANAALQEAMTSTSGAADKTAEALAKLSPNARSFVLAMRELGPAWTDLRKSVQDNMFAGLDASFTKLATTSMPTLKEGMGQVATSINGAAQSFASFWSSAAAQDSLRNIFAGTADLITAMQPGLAAITGGILDIGNAAAPVMGQLGASLGNVLGGIGTAFSDAFESGALTELIGHFSTLLDGLGGGLNGLLDGLIEFGNIVGPVLGPLLQTLGESIGALAPSLGQLGLVFSQALIDILPTLSQFISSLADGLAPVMPVIADLLKSLGAALTPLIPPLSEILQVVGVALVGVIDALAPAIGPLGDAFAALVAAVAPILPPIAELIGQLVAGLAPALTVLIDALAPLIESLMPILEQYWGVLAEVLSQVAGILAGALVTAIQSLAPLLPPLFEAWSQIVIALLPLLPVLAQLVVQLLPPFVQILQAILPVVTDVILIFADLVQQIVPILIPAIEKLGEIVGKIFGFIADSVVHTIDTQVQPAIDRFKSGFEASKNFISEAVENIKGFFTGMGETIGRVWDGVVGGIKTAVGKIGELLKKAGGAKVLGVSVVPGGDTIKGLGESLVTWSQSKATGGVVAGQRSNGVLFGPGTGTSDDILGLSASGLPTARVAAGEMLVNKVQTDRNLPLLTAINAGWTPSAEMVRALVYGSGLPTFASGGVIGSFKDLASQHAPGLTLTSAERDTNDYHGQGKAVDYSNGSGNTDEQLAWANFLADNYQDQLSELIYSDPRFTRNIKDGKIVDGVSFYGADTMAQHENHVHAAAQSPLGPPSQVPGDEAGVAPGGATAPDTRTNKQRYVDEIIGEGKRRNMSDKQIKAAIMTMLAETNGQMYANASDPESLNYAHDAVGSDHDSSGLFQQRNNGAWGTIADRMDPAKSAGMFYEELAKKDESGMSEAQLAQSVQRSAFSDGSNYAVKADEADSLIAESNARGNGAAMSSTSGAAAADAAGGGSAQQVFVTNWPSSMGGASAALTSTASSASYSSAPSSPSPTVTAAVAASPSTAFDPNNTGYDDTYYNDTVARGGIDGANAWWARQDFGPQVSEWGLNALKEIGGEAASPFGLSGRWGEAVDQGAAAATRAASSRGDVTINNTFQGFQGTPQQMIAEWERTARQGMSALTP